MRFCAIGEPIMPRPRKPTCAGNSSAKDTNEKLPMDKKRGKKKKKEHST